ncbi:MAG TPA: PIN domain-containing protein [Candidatus Limnocylindrales bacterium]|nr:PIN domain-containing protein [Candidatus Limnocylindrales bacterium]
MAVVVDTGPLLAAALKRDEAHELAASLLGFGGRDLLIPDPVVVECESILRRRNAGEAARRLLAALVKGVWVRVPLTPSLFAHATAIDRHYRDLDLGLVDCAVMAVAASTRGAVLTFDFRDFRGAPPRAGGAWDLVIDERAYQRAVQS